MKLNKLLILIVLLFGIFFKSFGQLASWDLLLNGSSTQNATNVVSDVFTGGNGISAITFGATGASATSWSTTLIDPTNYFQVSISPVSGYELNISALNFGERRSLTGIHTYEVHYSTNAAFTSSVVIQTVTVPDDDLERVGNITGLNIHVNNGDTIYFRWFGYNAEGSTGSWRINDASLKVLGTVSQANPNNNDSYVQSPTFQIASGNISSLVTTIGQSVPVFKVSVNDAGTSDGLPTNITQITLKNANPVNSADWQSTIQGITLLNGINPVAIQQIVINTNTIILNINSGDLVIPDGTSAELTFSVYLNQNSLTDGTQIQFVITSLIHGWSSDITGSGFLTTFTTDVISNIFTVNVVATKLQFLAIPLSVWANQNFNVNLEATDINNNLDNDANNQIVLQKTIGGGLLSSVTGLTQTLTNGLYNWSDVIYDNPGYFSISVIDQTSILSQASSGLINCIPTGQILNESFNDGDFSNNPSWSGETGDMIVNSELQLQLFTTTTAADTSYLVTPLWLALDSIEWQMYIKLGFDPSDNNYARYYLMSDNDNFKNSLNGYFLKFGENGSNDAVQLYYQSGNTITSICRALDGQIATSPAVRVKVIRTLAGLWRLYVDPTGGSSFELQAQGSETSFMTNGFYSGVFCRYTSTNASGKFNFDDFYCGPIQVDTIPPTYVDLSVLDSLHLDLHFSEGISLNTAQNVLNFSVNNGLGNPVLAIRDALDYKVIHLTFLSPFNSGTIYTITANNFKDFSNNTIVQAVNQNFVWYNALPFDVQINEIMADPTPVVGLPDNEYIELYNRSIYDIDLSNWTLTIGSNFVVFPSVKILANNYLILCTQSAQINLQTFGTTLGIISSTSSLTNAGNTVILKNKQDQIISLIQYSDSWYRNTNKKDGGWSLEQIEPLNPCGEDANWIASKDISGGTPGRINSYNGSNPDNANPELLRAILTLPDTLLLTFNEILFADDTLNVTTFTVNHGIGSPITAVFKDVTKKKIVLIFNQTFVKDTVYEVTVVGQLKDCAGNMVTSSNKAQFAIPDTIEQGSFVINEVLFNPNTGGVDYVELYNNSTEIYNLKDAELSNINDTSFNSIASEGFYLFPGDYAVLTSDPTKVYPFYSCPDKKAFVKITSMPTFNNSDGRVYISNKSYQIVDDFNYSESMHFQLLNSFQGVSLERIHPDLQTQDVKNWHSAAESAGFGTPGYKNSQFSQFDVIDASLTIEPEIFSPDNDGFNDVLNIRYKFDEPGYVANVTIFDARGRKVRLLVSNELLAIEGYFTWDGLNDANQKAALGVYVVFVEVFNLNGKVKHFKKACVVASKL